MSNLERRRELSKLTKRELIDWIIQAEQGQATTTAALVALRDRVDHAYGEEP